MKTGKYLGYIRVSTAKQGEKGVSLQEQRDAILRYSQRHALEITSWFEERETAAKRGRPVFNQMLKLLRQGKADGVIIHKIDRSARNLKDWADLGELIDQGIEVHFANESLDLHSRGGRLSADIQAVVAADYIRNLREETKKGFYGRIKQGLYPLPAPIGYLDMGKGKPKEPDPQKAPLVKRAFEFYDTRKYNFDSLLAELTRLGLHNKRGGKLSRTGLSTLLNNPFYIGLIRLKKTKETFLGSHQPLISKSLFGQVQDILEGKTNTRAIKYSFTFRRLLTCSLCKYSLIGEKQKGHVYYRCHTKNCPTTGIREELIETEILKRFQPLEFNEKEREYLKGLVAKLKEDWGQEQEVQVKTLQLRLDQLKNRLARLIDVYVDDRGIEKEIFEERKTTLLMDRQGLENKLNKIKAGNQNIPEKIAEFLELAGRVCFLYKMAEPEKKRDLFKIITLNRQVAGKNLDLTMAMPFSEVAKRWENTHGALERNRTSKFSFEG